MERPIDIDLTNSTNTRINQDPTEADINKFRSRIVQVLDRTMTIDRTDVSLPSDLESYWCPNDPIWKASAEQRGYITDTEYAKRNGLNDQADGKTVVGDVFHMIRPMWMKREEDKAKAKRYHDTHLSDKRKQKEEKDFLAQNELPPVVSSNLENISGPQIQEALQPNK